MEKRLAHGSRCSPQRPSDCCLTLCWTPLPPGLRERHQGLSGMKRFDIGKVVQSNPRLPALHHPDILWNR